jgi:hypothetical protein
MMEKSRPLVFSLFLSVLLVISALGAAGGLGVAVFNVEWVFLLGNIAFFAFLGYIIRLFIEEGIPRRSRRRGKVRRRDFIYCVITLLAIIYGLSRFLTKKSKFPGNPNGEMTSHRLISGSIEVGRDILILVSKPLPTLLYIIPLLAFLLVLIGLKKKKMARMELAETFDPWLDYETIDGTPEERVIKMYKNVVAGLVRRGYPYQKSWTHWEYEAKLWEIFPDLADLDVLTRIFEKAKYGKSLSREEVEIARGSYERLMNFLR